MGARISNMPLPRSRVRILRALCSLTPPLRLSRVFCAWEQLVGRDLTNRGLSLLSVEASKTGCAVKAGTQAFPARTEEVSCVGATGRSLVGRLGLSLPGVEASKTGWTQELSIQALSVLARIARAWTTGWSLVGQLGAFASRRGSVKNWMDRESRIQAWTGGERKCAREALQDQHDEQW